MSNALVIQLEQTFMASKARVWDVLTNPEMTKQYMFGCEVITDWKVGSSIQWRGKTEEGQDIIYVKGEITAIEQGTKVAFTMLDPNMGLQDIPENYVELTYELQEVADGTLFTLQQGDFSTTENGATRYEESLKGWKMVLPLISQILEG